MLSDCFPNAIIYCEGLLCVRIGRNIRLQRTIYPTVHKRMISVEIIWYLPIFCNITLSMILHGAVILIFYQYLIYNISKDCSHHCYYYYYPCVSWWQALSKNYLILLKKKTWLLHVRNRAIWGGNKQLVGIFLADCTFSPFPLYGIWYISFSIVLIM